MIERSVVALTLGTWNERTEPSRSTREDDGRLADTALAAGLAPGYMLVAFFAADIGFVDLDNLIRAAQPTLETCPGSWRRECGAS
jgi:hypothetical protein